MQRSAIPARASREVETDDGDYFEEPRMPSSSIRWRDTKGNQVIQQGNRRLVIHYDQPPPQKKRQVHWVLILGIGMLITILLYAGATWLGNWWNNQQLNATYGFPRTYQTDAVVGHNNDSVVNPSHFIFLNLNGKVEIIELPAGDASKAKIYSGPDIIANTPALIPVTGEFRNVGGKEEMIVHIGSQIIVYVSDGSQFKPKQ